MMQNDVDIDPEGAGIHAGMKRSHFVALGDNGSVTSCTSWDSTSKLSTALSHGIPGSAAVYMPSSLSKDRMVGVPPLPVASLSRTTAAPLPAQAIHPPFASAPLLSSLRGEERRGEERRGTERRGEEGRGEVKERRGEERRGEVRSLLSSSVSSTHTSVDVTAASNPASDGSSACIPTIRTDSSTAAAAEEGLPGKLAEMVLRGGRPNVVSSTAVTQSAKYAGITKFNTSVGKLGLQFVRGEGVGAQSMRSRPYVAPPPPPDVDTLLPTPLLSSPLPSPSGSPAPAPYTSIPRDDDDDEFDYEPMPTARGAEDIDADIDDAIAKAQLYASRLTPAARDTKAGNFGIAMTSARSGSVSMAPYASSPGDLGLPPRPSARDAQSPDHKIWGALRHSTSSSPEESHAPSTTSLGPFVIPKLPVDKSIALAFDEEGFSSDESDDLVARGRKELDNDRLAPATTSPNKSSSVVVGNAYDSRASQLARFERVASQILPWLYISGAAPAQDAAVIQQLNIKTIINCAADVCKNVFESRPSKRTSPSKGAGEGASVSLAPPTDTDRRSDEHSSHPDTRTDRTEFSLTGYNAPPMRVEEEVAQLMFGVDHAASDTFRSQASTTSHVTMSTTTPGHTYRTTPTLASRSLKPSTSRVPPRSMSGARPQDGYATCEVIVAGTASQLPSGALADTIPWPVSYVTLFLLDGLSQDVFSLFYRVIHAVEATRQSGGSVLIHCQQGVSRSGSFIIAYCMWASGLPLKDVYSFVRGSRPIVSPNAAFLCQLMEWEQYLTTMNGPRGFLPTVLDPMYSCRKDDSEDDLPKPGKPILYRVTRLPQLYFASGPLLQQAALAAGHAHLLISYKRDSEESSDDDGSVHSTMPHPARSDLVLDFDGSRPDPTPTSASGMDSAAHLPLLGKSPLKTGSAAIPLMDLRRSPLAAQPSSDGMLLEADVTHVEDDSGVAPGRTFRRRQRRRTGSSGYGQAWAPFLAHASHPDTSTSATDGFERMPGSEAPTPLAREGSVMSMISTSSKFRLHGERKSHRSRRSSVGALSGNRQPWQYVLQLCRNEVDRMVVQPSPDVLDRHPEGMFIVVVPSYDLVNCKDKTRASTTDKRLIMTLNCYLWIGSDISLHHLLPAGSGRRSSWTGMWPSSTRPGSKNGKKLSDKWDQQSPSRSSGSGSPVLKVRRRSIPGARALPSSAAGTPAFGLRSRTASCDDPSGLTLHPKAGFGGADGPQDVLASTSTAGGGGLSTEVSPTTSKRSKPSLSLALPRTFSLSQTMLVLPNGLRIPMPHSPSGSVSSVPISPRERVAKSAANNLPVDVETAIQFTTSELALWQQLGQPPIDLKTRLQLMVAEYKNTVEPSEWRSTTARCSPHDVHVRWRLRGVIRQGDNDEMLWKNAPFNIDNIVDKKPTLRTTSFRVQPDVPVNLMTIRSTSDDDDDDDNFDQPSSVDLPGDVPVKPMESEKVRAALDAMRISDNHTASPASPNPSKARVVIPTLQQLQMRGGSAKNVRVHVPTLSIPVKSGARLDSSPASSSERSSPYHTMDSSRVSEKEAGSSAQLAIEALVTVRGTDALSSSRSPLPAQFVVPPLSIPPRSGKP